MSPERIAELRSKTVKSATVGNPLADVVNECLDEIQDLEKDRARLEWLHKKQHSDCFQTDKHDWLICHYIGNQEHKDFRAATWREAIDAAMKGANEKDSAE